MRHLSPIRSLLALLAVGLPLAAQQDVVTTAGTTGPTNRAGTPFRTFGIRGGNFTDTFTGTLTVPRVTAPVPFEGGRITVRGTSDMRVDGWNVNNGDAGIQAEIDVDYEIRTSTNRLLVSATRRYSGGTAVLRGTPTFTISFPTLTATGTDTLTAIERAAFVGAGGESLRFLIQMRQNIFDSNTQQVVQTVLLGTTITVEVAFDGSPDYADLGGRSPGGPALYATGATVPGAANAFVATGLGSSAPFGLGVALSENPVPLFGGTLFANPIIIHLDGVAATDETTQLQFVWPGAPTGTSLIVQLAACPPSGSCLLSNAVRATGR